MKITLLNGDDSLGIDGVFYSGLDFSNVPNEIQVIQWNGTKGHIEYFEDEEGVKRPNDIIFELPFFIETIKPSWNAAAEQAAIKEAEFQSLLQQAAEVAQVIDNPVVEPEQVTVNEN